MAQFDEIYDVTIIGGGPCGLYAAYYAGLRRMRVKVIDIMPGLGGQLTALYPEKNIYDVAGFSSILGRDLIDNLVQQAFQYPITTRLGEKVVDLKIVDDKLLKLVTGKGEHLSHTVIIAMGMGAFVPRKLDIPDAEALEGKGIHYYPSDSERFRDKRVAIIGGGDSALDWALAIEKVARQVILIHRLKRFQGHEDSVDKLMASSVQVKAPNYELKAVHGEERLEGITYFDGKNGRETVEKVDDLLVCIGFLTNLGPLKSWGLELENNGIRVGSRMDTALPGVYACGDIVSYAGKVKLISTGTGEAAIAVNNAKQYLDPSVSMEPGVNRAT